MDDKKYLSLLRCIVTMYSYNVTSWDIFCIIYLFKYAIIIYGEIEYMVVHLRQEIVKLHACNLTSNNRDLI